MAKILSAGAGSGTGAGSGSLVIPATPVVNNDDISTAEPLNEITGAFDFAAAGYIDIVCACEETGHTGAGPGGNNEATEYGFVVTVTNSTAVNFDDFKFELGFGTGGSFVQSSTSDLIDWDTVGFLGGPQLTPTPTYSKTGSLSHGANLLTWTFSGANRIAPAETVTFTMQMDLSDGYEPGSTERLPAEAGRSGNTFNLTIRAYPSSTSSAGGNVLVDALPLIIGQPMSNTTCKFPLGPLPNQKPKFQAQVV